MSAASWGRTPPGRASLARKSPSGRRHRVGEVVRCNGKQNPERRTTNKLRFRSNGQLGSTRHITEMDKVLLTNAIRRLHELVRSHPPSRTAPEQAVLQFNALLKTAKSLFSSRPDIVAIKEYTEPSYVNEAVFADAVGRIIAALELRTPGSLGDLVAGIILPSDAPAELSADLQEFRDAIGLGLRKTALLLSGSIAEALLLLRHSDKSERGPGLAELVKEARAKRLFGRDTIRQLETLNDYRDLIHTRAGPRNRMVINDTRVEQAAMALKLLCAELDDTDVRF